MSSYESKGEMPKEELSVPGRRSCSIPEDKQLGNDPFFKENVDFCWVGKGYLLEVDDQGSCKCCWAFAATEAITAAYARKTGKVIPLSKQQLVDCMYKHYEKPTKLARLEKNECFPCSCNRAYQFAIDYGIIEETQYPYTEQRGECECPEPTGIKIKNYRKVKAKNLWNKKELEILIKQQPVTCGVLFAKSLKKHHGKGIYMGPTKKELELAEKQKEEEGTEAMHALLIVGYGVEEGVEFYLVKSSWGKGWGYKGFAKIERSVLSRLSVPVIG